MIWAFASSGRSPRRFDVLLFQLAVRADETHGAEGAGAQLADNMGVVFAVILPTSVGFWLILPSFQALIVPEAFRGPFAVYLDRHAARPVLLCAAAICGGADFPDRQKHRADDRFGFVGLRDRYDPARRVCRAALDGYWLALAQSGAQIVGLIVGAGVGGDDQGRSGRSALDILSTLVATAAMVVVVLPLRAQTPGLLVLAAQVAIRRSCVYGALAYALDIGRRADRKSPALVKSRA